MNERTRSHAPELVTPLDQIRRRNRGHDPIGINQRRAKSESRPRTQQLEPSPMTLKRTPTLPNLGDMGDEGEETGAAGGLGLDPFQTPSRSSEAAPLLNPDVSPSTAPTFPPLDQLTIKDIELGLKGQILTPGRGGIVGGRRLTNQERRELKEQQLSRGTGTRSKTAFPEQDPDYVPGYTSSEDLDYQDKVGTQRDKGKDKLKKAIEQAERELERERRAEEDIVRRREEQRRAELERRRKEDVKRQQEDEDYESSRSQDRQGSAGAPPPPPPHGSSGTQQVPGNPPLPPSRSRHSTGDLAPNLQGLFTHLTKPLRNLNDPDTRDDPVRIARNTAHLDRLSGAAIENALMAGHLQPFLTIIETRLKSLENRSNTLESHERLTSRALIEKRGSLKTNAYYDPEDAPPDTYRKALYTLALNVKVIEKKVLFDHNPFGFMVELVLESNKCATTHDLSKLQQQNAFLSFIPSSSKEFNMIRQCETLDGMFELISTYSSSLMTQNELESAINSWRLETNTQDTLISSTLHLLDLYTKNQRSDNYNKAELVQSVVARIQNDPKVSPYVVNLLTEFRLKIRVTDKMEYLCSALLACIKRIIKSPAPAPHKTGSHNPHHPRVHQLEYQPPQIQYAISYQPPVAPQPAIQYKQVNAVARPEGGESKNQIRKKKLVAKILAEANLVNAVQGNQSKGRTPFVPRPPSNGVTCRPDQKGHSYLLPFKDPAPHIGKSGNTLSKALEAHFGLHCFRCGHSSHKGTQCKLYPERNTVLTLCTVCLQGMHETCRSTRPDLVRKRSQAPAGPSPTKFTNKQLVEMYYQQNPGAHSSQNYPFPPAGQYRVKNHGGESDSE